MDVLTSLNPKIEGVVVTPLKQIIDLKGSVMHFIKKSDKSFSKFGEVYFSRINREIVKGWKLHKVANQNFCVPYGKVLIKIIDFRAESESYKQLDEIILDNKQNYFLLHIPAGLWYSFKCINNDYSLLANLSSIEHDKNEISEKSLDNNIFPKW